MNSCFFTSVITKVDTETITISNLTPNLSYILSVISDYFLSYLNTISKVPGGKIILRYIKSSYKNDPIRSFFELALFIFAIYYFLRSKKKENKADTLKLSEEEINNLCEEWTPEELIKKVDQLSVWELKSIPVVVNDHQNTIIFRRSYGFSNQKDDLKYIDVVNFASNDFLNFNKNEKLIEAAKSCISESGVGACGPPNFYGNQDYHQILENDLAVYLEAEKGILYGQDLATANSVIPAFIKRNDLCIVDKKVNFSIQKALISSRCDIEWYEHNDLNDLENVLKDINPILNQKRLRRRFIITESLFASTGKISNLPKLIKLKKKYKYRLFLDETLSIGILGKTGKGLTEHFKIPRSEIDITVGLLAISFGSSGGFCVGISTMINHQRIQSAAYVFSASLPPYTLKVASQSIKDFTTNLNENGESILIKKLSDNLDYAISQIKKIFHNNKYLKIISDTHSPIIHFSINQNIRQNLELPYLYGNDYFSKKKKKNESDFFYNIESFILQKLIDYVLNDSNTLLTRSKNIIDYEDLPVLNPHLLIFINTGLNKKDIEKMLHSLHRAVEKIFPVLKSKSDLLDLKKEMLNY